MIELHYWPTPNGHKITMFLEETGLDYEIHPVDIGSGDQHKPEFLEISPNGKMPAIVDRAPADGGPPISVFESGAILQYLAEKSGKLIPGDLRGRITVLEWLSWQVAGLGPMLGQNHHFSNYAPEKIPYAIKRYQNETRRLYRVLDAQLKDRTYIVGDSYSIADIACYPWVVAGNFHDVDMEALPHLKAWCDAIKERPATRRAYEIGSRYSSKASDEERAQNLFGQRA
ncbi:MAG: glutathione S-transferase N-terminal domain-containing protein [Rhodanobacteraceae bacterium]